MDRITKCPGFSDEFDPATLFTKILVPIDFSPESRRALITACELRVMTGAELHVFLVRDKGVNDEFIAGLGQPWTETDVEVSARDQLEYFCSSICKGVHCVTGNVTIGEDVVHGVADTARRIGASIVVLAAHEKKAGIFRNRAERIVKELEIPVLVLKGTKSAAELKTGT